MIIEGKHSNLRLMVQIDITMQLIPQSENYFVQQNSLNMLRNRCFFIGDVFHKVKLGKRATEMHI